MHLKKISLRGFKSFAEPTEIAFNPGISGIVGPNGCGKSNVVDAVKWVLGTLSPKSLRGDEMMDVIFKGGEGTGPSGYAEVSLTLDNADRKLSIEFDEVSVTRRLYSSGESQYLINKADCRLKDVRELFYGTGIGTDNYAIIEQGKIDRLVMSNPVERKAVFEEASGISKYRAKRRETILKLDRVSQDLLRLGDVIREIQREMRSIKAQASKAEKCRQFQEELKQKKLQVSLNDYHQAVTKLREVRNLLEVTRGTDSELRATADDLRTQGERYQEEIRALSLKETETRTALTAEETAVAKLEQLIAGNIERLEELTSHIHRTDAEYEELSGKAVETQSLKSALEEERRRGDNEATAQEAQLEEIAANLQQAVEECRDVARRLEEKKSDFFQMLQREAQYRNEIGQMRSVKETLADKRDRCHARIAEIADESSLLSATIASMDDGHKKILHAITSLTEHLHSEEEASVRMREDLVDCDRQVSESRESLHRLMSRRDLLAEMESRLEGMSSGVKGILQNRETGFPGIIGTISDFLNVKTEHLPVIEAVLGEDSTGLIARDAESAYAAAEFVRENSLGRIAIYALDRVTPPPAVEGSAFDLISCAEEIAAVMKSIFGRYRVAADLREARTIMETAAPDARPYAVVTMNGDLLRHDGRISTGASNGDMSVLSRKTELRQLHEAIEASQTTVDGRARQKSEKEHLLRVSTEKSDVLRKQIYERNVERIEAARTLDESRQRAKVLDDEQSLIRSEIDEVEAEIDSGKENEERLQQLLVDMTSLQKTVNEDITRMTETLAGYERTKAEIHDRETALRVQQASTREKLDSVVRRISAIDDDLAALNEKQQKTRELAEQMRSKATTISLENSLKTTERDHAIARRDEFHSALSTILQARNNAVNTVNDVTRHVRETEIKIAENGKALQEAAIEENSVSNRLQSICEKISADCGVDAETAYGQYQASEHVDWKALGAEIEQIRAKINELGTVNMFAIERLKELEERLNFLKTQETDILKSKGQLEDLIKTIDQESRDLFTKTIETVREHFNVIFRKVFGGGKAEIVIEQCGEGQEIETGIEIVVRPPGKELTNLSLLSGGEKSLTALSLIMALFKANPSPFCILDEADAALDEHNVDKFTRLINDFVSDTQFIVITHNKRTMAIADVLYGVTMEKRGISKKVTVNLSKGEKGADDLVSLAGAAR